MNYILFDLEFNQGYKYRRKSKEKSRDLINPKCPFEIIQIGAIKLNKNLETIDTLDRFIKPQVYSNIHPFIEKMTGITSSDLINSKPFKEVYEQLISFIGEDGILCPWGKGDIRELVRNINFHKLDLSLISNLYIDVQKHASSHLNSPKGTSIGLKNAAKALNIPLKSDFHNAFNDAYYTAEIFKKIYKEDIKPSVYELSQSGSRDDNPKTKLDLENLFNQFEKMYSRKITKKEKAMIKLAYMMGRTGQFQVDVDGSKN